MNQLPNELVPFPTLKLEVEQVSKIKAMPVGVFYFYAVTRWNGNFEKFREHFFLEFDTFLSYRFSGYLQLFKSFVTKPKLQADFDSFLNVKWEDAHFELFLKHEWAPDYLTDIMSNNPSITKQISRHQAFHKQTPYKSAAEYYVMNLQTFKNWVDKKNETHSNFHFFDTQDDINQELTRLFHGYQTKMLGVLLQNLFPWIVGFTLFCFWLIFWRTQASTSLSSTIEAWTRFVFKIKD